MPPLPTFVIVALSVGCVVAALPVAGEGTPCTPRWLPGFSLPGIEGNVKAMIRHDDRTGRGECLYVGGSIYSAGQTLARGIARWDGTTWTPLGLGVDGDVLDMCEFDAVGDGTPDLIVAGDFNTAGGIPANRIARWDGATWSSMAGPTNLPIVAVCAFNNGSGMKLYAATEHSVSAPLYRFDGNSWQQIATADSAFYDMAVYNEGNGDRLFIGGEFDTINGQGIKGLARYNGTTFSQVFTNPSFGYVRALDVHNDGAGTRLLVGGNFGVNGSVPIIGFARWNGFSWDNGGSVLTGLPGHDPTVWAIDAIDAGQPGGSRVAIAGEFTAVNSVTVPKVALQSNNVWNAAGPALDDGMPQCIQWFDGNDDGEPTAVVGGDFIRSGPLVLNCIAESAAGQWNVMPRGNGVRIQVFDFAKFDDGGGPALFAAGQFELAGSTLAANLAKFNGSLWLPLAGGLTSSSTTAYCSALEVFNDGSGEALYAAGAFDEAGEVPARNVARWNGTNWSALSNGLFSGVNDFAAFDDGTGIALYACGIADGDPLGSVVKWTGNEWVSLGLGPEFNGACMAVFDDGTGEALYVGGEFTTERGSPGNGIAKWDGQQWSAVGDGFVNIGDGFMIVHDLAIYDDGSGPALFAAGRFTSSGATSLNDIAKWNGATWEDVGGGVSGTFGGSLFDLHVHSDVSGTRLFAAGRFGTAGSVAANNIAAWDGRSWAALDSGIAHYSGFTAVFALTDYDDGLGGGPSLMVGGNAIRSSGDVTACNVARWGCSPCDPPGAIPDCNLNSIDDGCEIASLLIEDCDGNLVPDPCDIAGGSGDCNGSGRHDDCEVLYGVVPDCNANGIPDSCDIAGGTSFDCNINGVPDECDTPVVPLNESCSVATIVTVGAHPFDCSAAVSDPDVGITACGAGDVLMSHDVWFRAIVTCNGVATFSLCGSCFDAKLAVYASCPVAGSQPIACSDDYCGVSPRVSVVNTTPTVYRVRIGGAGLNGGRGVFTLTCEPCPADVSPAAGNDQVDVDDLLAVINAWGPCADPASCLPDIAPVGGNTLVNVDDLLGIINAWGPCP